MRQFYFSIVKGATLSHQLTWSHYCELLSLDSINKINYYIDISANQNLSVCELRSRIKSNEYERLPEETRLKLQNKEETKIEDFVKNPIIIKNSLNIDIISEKVLKKLIYMKQLID